MAETHKALTPELQYLFDEAFVSNNCGEYSKGEVHYLPWFSPWDELDIMRGHQESVDSRQPVDTEARIAEGMKGYLQFLKSRRQ